MTNQYAQPISLEVADCPAHLFQHHWEELRVSAISPSIIKKNFSSIDDPREVDRLLNRNSNKRWKHSEHLVPCWAVTGLDPLGWERIEDGVQIKPDNPELGEDGKPKKYIGATGYDTAPLFLETDNPEYWGEVLKDVSIPLFITEGAKKAASALSILLACISIPGVSTCRKLGRLHRHLEVFCKFGRTAYLCFDNDVMTKPQVQKALLKMGTDISSKGAKVMVVELPPGEAKGMDDFIYKHGEEEFKKLVNNALTIEEWRKKLEKNWEQASVQDKLAKGRNTNELLDTDRKSKKVYEARKEVINEAYSDSLKWNELSLQIEIDGEALENQFFSTRIARDTDIKFSERETRAIVYELAQENSYHPVREYLNSVALIYNDTQIIENLASRLFGTTEPLHNTMFKKWLIAAVARIMEPGCKADDILILCGDQGFLKSTLFETLASTDWFLDSCEGTGNDKDTLMQMHYSWIIELAEVDRFLNKRSASDLKKSLSVREDKFRLPYGAGIETFKRKFVTCGTTNQDEFLTDPTGNRRYWVVEVKTKIDIDWVKEHRSEIWAAAVHLYHQGHEWYLNDEERARHAELMKPFEISDTWEDYIEPYIAIRNEVTVADILHNCLFIEPALQKKSQQMRVAEILKRMGWTKKDTRSVLGRKIWISPGGGKVEAKVAAPKTQTNTESQDSAATSPTFLEKNFLTGENNNFYSNPKTEIKNGLVSGEVGANKHHSPETQAQQASHTSSTSASNSASTSKKIKVGDTVKYVGDSPTKRAQYQGELKVHSLEYGKVCVETASGRISTWLDYQEIQR